MRDFLNRAGKTPLDREVLIRWRRNGAKTGKNSLTRETGRGSSGEFLFCEWKISECNSFRLTSRKESKDELTFGNLLGCCLSGEEEECVKER
jgi:hypothetical protein